MANIVRSDGVTVLWGPPGRGKSTYLSHCVARIDRAQAVVVRHHYFLSVRDRSEGRFHYHAITRSLEHQFQTAIPDLAREPASELREIIKRAAHYLQRHALRLIVVIDGLDHVWRDHRDHEDMTAVFDALLPLSSGVHLVVGTQRVANQHLPRKLVQTLPANQWTELPPMSVSAIYEWLRTQDGGGRLTNLAGGQPRDTAIQDLATAFHEITQGLPLHLIYSFESLVRSGDAMTTTSVRALPSCPDGDIRHYYRSLWESAQPAAQLMLHVLSGLKFGPPPFALAQCFALTGANVASLDDVSHLLDYRETEVRPFHGSLFAFARELPDHVSVFAQHAIRVLNWLENDSPAYWRWAWLWITQAQLGDSSDLVAGPSREWAIDALTRGYPIDQLIAILDRAEQAAFDVFDLPRLLYLRSLKTRAVNGPDFQTQDWPLFHEGALSLTDDPYIPVLLRDALDRVRTQVIPFVMRASDASIQPALIREAIAELASRRAHIVSRAESETDELDAVWMSIVSLFATRSADESQQVEHIANRTRVTEALLDAYVRESLVAGHTQNVFLAGRRWSSPRIDRDVLAALCVEGLAPSAHAGLKASDHPAVCVLACLKGQRPPVLGPPCDLGPLFAPDELYEPRGHQIHHSLYDMFFSALTSALSRGQATGWAKIPIGSHDSWLGRAARALERIADDLAIRWRVSHGLPSLVEFYSAFELEPPSSASGRTDSDSVGVRLALRDIAIDLCTIAYGLDANSLIQPEDVTDLPQMPFWSDDLWLETFIERRLRLHTPGAAQVLVERGRRSLDYQITEFTDRATKIAQLALFAANHELTSDANALLRRGFGCVLGYGWRKDLFALQVLESLEMLIQSGDTDASTILLDLAGEFEAIPEYTDRDETTTILEDYYESIPKYFPERSPDCYAHLIRSQDWSNAERLALSFATTTQVESRTGQLLIETYLSHTESGPLHHSPSVESPTTANTLRTVAIRTGRAITNEPVSLGDSDDGAGATTRAQGDVKPPDASDYPPGCFDTYLKATTALSEYSERATILVGWLRHWNTAGMGRQALSDLQSVDTDDVSGYYLRDVLFHAYQVSLELQGRSAAFRWLVRSFVALGGWEPWFSDSERAHAQMREVAKHYRNRWQEFIRETARPRYPSRVSDNGIAMGPSRLVRYLLEVGQSQLASLCGRQLATIFRQELSEQPIRPPEWSR